jgi:hypothetical protein
VAVPVGSDDFPEAAKLATDLLGRARLRNMPEPTVGKVPLDVIQLSIECNDPTLECYLQVARSLHADLMIFGEITPGPGKDHEEFTLTVSLLDANAKQYVKRAARKFPSVDDAKYDMHLVVDEATKP